MNITSGAYTGICPARGGLPPERFFRSTDGKDKKKNETFYAVVK